MVEVAVVTSELGTPEFQSSRLQRLGRLTEIAMADLRSPLTLFPREPHEATVATESIKILRTDPEIRRAIEFLSAIAPVRDALGSFLPQLVPIAQLVARSLLAQARPQEEPSREWVTR